MRVARSRIALIATAFGLFGAVAGGLVSLAIPDRFQSTGQISTFGEPQSAEVQHLTEAVFSRKTLKQVIEEYDLYQESRRKRPLEDVVDQMRHDIGVQRGSGAILQVSFLYPDRYKAQQVTRKLIGDFIDENVIEHFQLGDRASPSNVALISAPDLPQVAATPNRMGIVSAGIGGGLLLGLTVSLLGTRQK